MRLGFRFSNLCGTVHKCGNVLFTSDGNSLISPVGNRVTIFDLVEHKSTTLDIETRSNIARIAVSNNGRVLLAVDEDGSAVVINLQRHILVHRMNFKEKVRDVRFSPDDGYIAVALGRKLQVWRTPEMRREFSPFVLHRTYTGHFDDVSCVCWAPNGRFIVTGSKDMSARLYSLNPIPGFVPVTLGGHKSTIVQAAFASTGDVIYTVSKDGACFVWEWKERPELSASALSAVEGDGGDSDSEDGSKPRKQIRAMSTVSALVSRDRHRVVPDPCSVEEDRAFSILSGEWRLVTKHFFKQDNAKVYSASYHVASGLLIVGFSSGIFGIYTMPECSLVHTLSISQHRIHTCAVNSSGEWLAFGSRTLGQLLVWEWQSESYILKQQGHFHDLNTLAYSSDGTMIATGGDDGKVKLWNTTSGFCFVTFTDHEAAVMDIAFIAGKGGRGSAIVTASLDGTVRAFDLTRYRNFKTLTPPSPAQFMSLAVDASGEVVCAGAKDPFDVFVWSLQTGKLLDVFSGHEAPVCGLAFSPTQALIASCSWDKTVRVWDVYRSGAATETFLHGSDVLSVAFRPDGGQLCSSTRDGQLHYWNVKTGVADGVIEAHNDVSGGRKKGDARTAASSARAKCFTTVTYSADGSCTLAGGLSRFVCLYAITPRLLMRKYQLTHNRSLDGVLDKLNSKDVVEGGDADLSGSDDEERPDTSLPGAKRGDYVSRKTRLEIRSKCVKFSPSGTSFAVASTDGLMIFSQDASITYAPVELSEDVTPDAVSAAVSEGRFTHALVMALHLNLTEVIQQAVVAVPKHAIDTVTAAIPRPFLQRLFEVIASLLSSSPQVEQFLSWSLSLLQHHGDVCVGLGSGMTSCLRTIQKSIVGHADVLGRLCDDNTYSLEFLASASSDVVV